VPLRQAECSGARPGPAGQEGGLSGVGFFREVFIMIKRFEKRAILLLG
jgi:hypothetical protein